MSNDLESLEQTLLARVAAANDEAALEALRVEALGKQGSISALMKNLGSMNPEEFRRFGHLVVDWIADYRARGADRPVMSRAEPGSIRAQLPPSPPNEPEGFEAVLRDLDEVVLPGLSHWQHPRFFGYFPSNGELSSVLGDYLSTGLGVLGLSWQSSPALTEIEETTTDWVRQMIGLSDAWSGVTAGRSQATCLVSTSL